MARRTLHRPTRRELRRNLIAAWIGLIIATIMSLLYLVDVHAVHPGGPLHALESWLEDAFQRVRSPESYGAATGRDPRDLITLIAIDERSLAELGLLRNWSRTYYASLLNRLLDAPPRVIALDLGFFEPSPDDSALSDAFQLARAPGHASGIRPGVDVIIPAVAPGLQPVPELAANAVVASANAVSDDRGVVRTMPLFVPTAGRQIPTMGLAAMTRYLRRPDFVDGRPDQNTYIVAGREIPVDDNGNLRINYFGPPSSVAGPQTFRVHSFVDVLRGRADPASWRDRIVFVGLANAVGFADDFWTPVSENGNKMSGVEIHANVAATLLSTQFLRAAAPPFQLATVGGVSLIVALLAVNLGVVRSLIATGVVLNVFAWTNLALAFNMLGAYIQVAHPLLAAGLTFVAVTSYRVAIEQRHGRALQRALGAVIPPAVAQQISRDPDRVQLGGERRVVTVLFTDLRGFTSFSETVEPELLTQVISEYLQAMSNVVFRYGGTVDKYIGDAVMAFWNAPLDDREHGVHACEAALDMQAELGRLNEEWISRGLPAQSMRIGINTGPASVGNMGTPVRFAYTALGDTINLGARLEPLNNEYGTAICISQTTLDATRGRKQFLVRFLDLVVVKGKHQPVPVYELLGRADDRDVLVQYTKVLEAYDRAILLYQAGQFDNAAKFFRDALSAAENHMDAPSRMYLQRCEELRLAPLDPTWDGVYVMRHK